MFLKVKNITKTGVIDTYYMNKKRMHGMAVHRVECSPEDEVNLLVYAQKIDVNEETDFFAITEVAITDLPVLMSKLGEVIGTQYSLSEDTAMQYRRAHMDFLEYVPIERILSVETKEEVDGMETNPEYINVVCILMASDEPFRLVIGICMDEDQEHYYIEMNFINQEEVDAFMNFIETLTDDTLDLTTI